jgi:hypothetical protein
MPPPTLILTNLPAEASPPHGVKIKKLSAGLSCPLKNYGICLILLEKRRNLCYNIKKEQNRKIKQWMSKPKIAKF